ncbi:MAG TPA: NAD(P)-dependent oxidoreductase [Leucothrix mucor]|nr:NAD(P)-dependent oxidoreductase [Leucothrix mucor]
MTKKVSFLGLGAMGYPMAGHLANKGFDVTVYNRTTAVAEKWLSEYKGAIATTPALATAKADFVLTCVGNDNDVRSLYCDDNGIFSAIKANTILIDHTTTSADLARELSQIAPQYQTYFLDAPVSGGQIGAQNGCLTIMVGGEKNIFEKASPVMQSYAQAISLIGEAGFGQSCKMVNQLCITGILQGLSEALTFAKAAGIDAQTVVNTLQHGAAGSWQMINRTETMMNDEFDFGFAIDWMLKDLNICFDEAQRLKVDLPLAKQVSNTYESLREQGYNRADTSVLIKQFDA